MTISYIDQTGTFVEVDTNPNTFILVDGDSIRFIDTNNKERRIKCIKIRTIKS